MLVKRDGTASMVASRDLTNTDELWSTDTNTWVAITELAISAVSHQVVSINCEPYDMFYTKNFLVYDGFREEDKTPFPPS